MARALRFCTLSVLMSEHFRGGAWFKFIWAAAKNVRKGGRSMRHTLWPIVLGAAVALGLILSAGIVSAQTAAEVLGPAGVAPLTAPQPPARIIVDPPLPDPLREGMVFIQYRAVNLRIVPVFGPKALAVAPRIGHIHVVVDNAPWHWADASGEPLIIVGLPPGPHKVEVILANANHQPLDRATVSFMVPTVKTKGM
jgi:hypothetical protein